MYFTHSVKNICFFSDNNTKKSIISGSIMAQDKNKSVKSLLDKLNEEFKKGSKKSENPKSKGPNSLKKNKSQGHPFRSETFEINLSPEEKASLSSSIQSATNTIQDLVDDIYNDFSTKSLKDEGLEKASDPIKTPPDQKLKIPTLSDTTQIKTPENTESKKEDSDLSEKVNSEKTDKDSFLKNSKSVKQELQELTEEEEEKEENHKSKNQSNHKTLLQDQKKEEEKLDEVISTELKEPSLDKDLNEDISNPTIKELNLFKKNSLASSKKDRKNKSSFSDSKNLEEGNKQLRIENQRLNLHQEILEEKMQQLSQKYTNLKKMNKNEFSKILQK